MAEYIEREAAKAKATYMHGFGQGKYVSVANIDKIPAADVVEVVHGEWVQKYEPNSYSDFFEEKAWIECSKCGHVIPDYSPDYFDSDEEYREYMDNYCPNCGAKMDKQ